MKYYAKDTFTQISETSGTIQNASRIYNVEISNQAVVDSGILLFPLNKFSFSDTTLYIRCADKGGWAEIRVVPFLLDFASVSSDATSSVSFASDDDALQIIHDGWNYIYDAPDDVDAIIYDMLSSPDSVSSDDGWDSFVHSLFP